MIPVKQTRTGKKGNCLEACVASILELPMEDVPSFGYDTGYIRKMNRFLRGFGYFCLIIRSDTGKPLELPPDCITITSGPSPRLKDIYHSVIMKNGKVIHDPHPDNTGLKPNTEKFWEYDFLIPIDPAQTAVKGGMA